MSSNGHQQKPGPCANCGKPERGFMGSSAWGHSFSCCGDKCGVELMKKLDANMATPEYDAACSALHEAQETLRDIKYKGLLVDRDPLGHIYGRL